MKKVGKVIIGVVIIGALAAVVVPRLLRKDPPVEAAALPNVSYETPETTTITLESGLIGTVEASDMIYVTPKAAGDISQVLVKAGDYVKQGQALCKIDSSKQIDAAKIQMDSAAVALENANASLNRMAVLYSTGDIAAQTYEQTQTQAKAAQLTYDSAKLNYNTQVEYATVTAPIAGTLESVTMDLHSTVSQGSQLCVITGEGGKKVSFSVSEKIKNNLHMGDKIRITKLGSEYTAVITKMANLVSASTGLFDIEASVDQGEGLSNGSTVKLYVVSDNAENVITLPVDAVYYDGGDAYVYTCENGNTVHKVPVETGIFNGQRIEIKSGLTLADQVIVTWSSELYEGSKVNGSPVGAAETAASTAETAEADSAANADQTSEETTAQ